MQKIKQPLLHNAVTGKFRSCTNVPPNQNTDREGLNSVKHNDLKLNWNIDKVENEK